MFINSAMCDSWGIEDDVMKRVRYNSIITSVYGNDNSDGKSDGRDVGKRDCV